MATVRGNTRPSVADVASQPSATSNADTHDRPGPEPVTKTLRQAAQIAMLRRALAAAESPDLPDKAVCDYLQTLSQMAKIEATMDASTAPHQNERPSDRAKPCGDLNQTDDVEAAPGESAAENDRADFADRLRRTIRDIYGIDPDSPATRSAGDTTKPPASNAPSSTPADGCAGVDETQ